jgi:hypothetical protein
MQFENVDENFVHGKRIGENGSQLSDAKTKKLRVKIFTHRLEKISKTSGLNSVVTGD